MSLQRTITDDAGARLVSRETDSGALQEIEIRTPPGQSITVVITRDYEGHAVGVRLVSAGGAEYALYNLDVTRRRYRNHV